MYFRVCASVCACVWGGERENRKEKQLISLAKLLSFVELMKKTHARPGVVITNSYANEFQCCCVEFSNFERKLNHTSTPFLFLVERNEQSKKA